MDQHAEEESTDSFNSCDICAGLNSAGILFDSPIPSMSDASFEEEAPKDGTCADWNTTISDTTGTCADWNNTISDTTSSGSQYCFFYMYHLACQCCDCSNMTATYSSDHSNTTATYSSRAQFKPQLFTYKTTMPPVPAGEDNLDVSVLIMFWHLLNINTVEDTAEICFSIDLLWEDEHLAWDTSKHDGCLDFHSHASLNIGTTEIFVPDFGTVHWEQMGILKAICAFTGLEPIPFDMLSWKQSDWERKKKETRIQR
eukprot:5337430-Ditylum_brightwellii.AAC.1